MKELIKCVKNLNKNVKVYNSLIQLVNLSDKDYEKLISKLSDAEIVTLMKYNNEKLFNLDVISTSNIRPHKSLKHYCKRDNNGYHYQLSNPSTFKAAFFKRNFMKQLASVTDAHIFEAGK